MTEGMTFQKYELLCFHYLRVSGLYLKEEQVLLHGGQHVAPPCFNCSTEQTNMELFFPGGALARFIKSYPCHLQ